VPGIRSYNELPCPGPITVKPGTKLYKTYSLQDSDLKLHQVTSASSVKVWVSHMQFATLQGGGGFSETEKYDIRLDKRGQKVNFQQGSTLLFEDASVKIYLQKAGDRTYGGYEWSCTVINTGSENLMLGSSDAVLNGQTYANDSLFSPILMPYDIRCPAGQVTAFIIKYTDNVTGELNLTFAPQFYDFAGEHLLYEGTAIKLTK